MLARQPSPSNGGALLAANNLQDLASAASARAILDAYGKEDLHRIAGGYRNQDVILSDGSTSNRRLEATPGSAGAIAGMPATFWVKRFYVPTNNPSASAYLTGFGPSGTTDPVTEVNGWGLYITTGGSLRCRQAGTASAGANARIIDYAAFRATYSGQWVQIVLVFESGNTTANPKLYINGVDLSTSWVDASVGTIPNWMPPTLDTTKFLIGYNWPAGPVPEVEYGPGAWSLAEALAAAQTGLAPTWWQVGTGSAANLIASGSAISLGAADGATNGLGSGFNATPSYAAGARTGGVGAYYSVTTRTGASGDVKTGTLGAFPGGVKVRITGWVRKSAGATVTTMFTSLRDSGGGTTYSNVVNVNISETWTEFSGDYVSTGPAARWALGFANGANGEEIHIDDLSFSILGPVAKWEIQPVATCYDAGTNKIPLLLTAGMTPITRRRKWVIQGSTNTNGNQQLLGASAFLAPYDYTRHMIDSLETNATSTATVAIGSASGGAQYKASAALVSGRNRHSLVTPIPATANIWVASNNTDTLRHTIRGHLID